MNAGGIFGDIVGGRASSLNGQIPNIGKVHNNKVIINGTSAFGVQPRRKFQTLPQLSKMVAKI